MFDRPDFINLLVQSASEGVTAFLLRLIASDGAVPRTIYVARSVVLDSFFELPPAWTLMMAPGAVITVDPQNAGLVIHGPLDIGVEPRFHCTADPLGRTRGVRLAGPLPTIEADWWVPREGTPGAPPNGSSVQQAIDALWWRYTEGLEPAPIRLAGSYLVDAPIALTPPDDEYYEVWLQAAPSSPDAPATLIANGRGGPLDALITVEGRTALLLDGVSFDSRAVPVLFSPTFGADACVDYTGSTEGCRASDCAFTVGGGGVGLRHAPVPRSKNSFLEPVPHDPPLKDSFGSVRIALFDASDAEPRLLVERCAFTAEGGDVMRAAVEVRGHLPPRLRVSDCTFTGGARAMLVLPCGDLGLTNCAFDNAHRPVGGAARGEGVDITFAPLEVSLVDFVDNGRPWLTVTHCVSRSASFLYGLSPSGAPSTGAAGAVITGLKHLPRGVLPMQRGSSVLWGRGFGSRALVFQGCQLGGDVTLEDGTAEAAVVDLGVSFVLPDPLAAVPGFYGVPLGGGALQRIDDARVLSVETRAP